MNVKAGLDVSLTGIQAYASAKAGQIGLVRQLGHELGEFGITVSCVAPGFVRSNPTTEKQWQALGVDGQKKLVSGIAMRRLGNPEDIASAVVLKDGSTIDDKDLRTHLSKSITTFKIPRQILILDEIPKGNTGKIQRIGLAKKLGLEL